MRTATAATDRSRTGGICHARVISHAETPARASALPSESTPRAIAARTRGNRGRSSVKASASGSGRGTTHLPVGDHLDDLVADGQNRRAVAHDDHGRTGPGPLDDGPQNAFLGMGVQVRGRLV